MAAVVATVEAMAVATAVELAAEATAETVELAAAELVVATGVAVVTAEVELDSAEVTEVTEGEKAAAAGGFRRSSRFRSNPERFHFWNKNASMGSIQNPGDTVRILKSRSSHPYLKRFQFPFLRLLQLYRPY